MTESCHNYSLKIRISKTFSKLLKTNHIQNYRASKKTAHLIKDSELESYINFSLYLPALKKKLVQNLMAERFSLYLKIRSIEIRVWTKVMYFPPTNSWSFSMKTPVMSGEDACLSHFYFRMFSLQICQIKWRLKSGMQNLFICLNKIC